jgi:hypothetical protein
MGNPDYFCSFGLPHCILKVGNDCFSYDANAGAGLWGVL